MFDNILVVCVGNICRSPTAEFLLQQALPNKTVHSAGLGALVGHDTDATAKQVAEQHGVECPTHSARQLTKEMCRQADVILVKEDKHKEAVSRLAPEVRGKTFLLVQWNNNQYFHQALQPFDGMEVLVGIDIHDASRVWVRELVHHEGKPAQGALICVADYFANKQRYFPHSLTDKAKETRARGRMRRLDLKREEVEAEARGVYFIEAQALAPVAEFIEPARAPEAVAVIAPQPEAVSSGAPEPAHAFADDEEVCMAVAIMADHGTLNTMNPGWRITLEEKIHRPAGRRKLEMAGVDPWALLDLLRSAA